jgi:hypothetical protein
MERVARETPPLSSLLTGEDVAIIGTAAALTGAAVAVYKKAKLAGAIAAGAESAGIGILATLLVRGTAQTVSNGLSYDEVNTQFKKEYDLCVAKYGPSFSPVSLSSVARSVHD